MMREDAETIAAAYLEEGRMAGCKGREVIIQRYRLRKLIEYLNAADTLLAEVGIKQAQGFQGWLLEGGTYQRGTVANFLKQAVRFFDWLKKKKLVLANPFKELSRLRMEKRIPGGLLKEDQMNTLLKALSGFSLTDGDLTRQLRRYKTHVICELMYATGLRIGEVAEIEERKIDFRRSVIAVKSEKKGESRLVYLNEYARKVLELYVKEMRSYVADGNSRKDKLFLSSAERLIVVVNEELRKVCRQLKIGRCTCHGFRHAFGYHLLRAGCDIRNIQEFLGHKYIHTTEIYTKVDKEDLRRILTAYHPRKFKGAAK